MKTVSDSKRAFHAAYPRPINSIYRRVIEELLVEMHLLSVNADFKSDPIYYLGIVTSFERLMQGYEPEADKEKIFNALCTSTDADPQIYKAQAGTLLSLAKDKSTSDLIAWLSNPEAGEDTGYIVEPIKAISANDNFKYSRPFAIGIYTLLEESDRELVQDRDKRDAILDTIIENFGLSGEKMKKDLELYRGNLEKMTQLLKVIEDVLEASRKQREKREQEKQSGTTETKETEEATAE
ncbi:photosystem II biogenesis protein Psp29 [Waterburya agarophytonicola K14]|uniref:Protein Thf1 n=2 Tax=Waterburya TaxID=2886915 RepID=A0A964BNK9_9CYAN|nr:photosystem II biogenesis protein Psp29 [Waterburya agarophytonicola]MCC0175442.1 photosystem II biogenesis protein Psp29 [Waterburya agarophytonicola KI4]